jgi:ribonuclease J
LLVEENDLVLFSSILIPGNEMLVSRLIAQLTLLKVRTLQSADSPLPIHVSGHPNQGELDLLYRYVQPAIAIPVHGEAAHMRANAAVAKLAGVPQQFTGQNGDLFVLAPQPRIWPQAVATGRIAVEN